MVVGSNLTSFFPHPGQISHLSFSIILLHMFAFVNCFFCTLLDASLLIGNHPSSILDLVLKLYTFTRLNLTGAGTGLFSSEICEDQPLELLHI